MSGNARTFNNHYHMRRSHHERRKVPHFIHLLRRKISNELHIRKKCTGKCEREWNEETRERERKRENKVKRKQKCTRNKRRRSKKCHQKYSRVVSAASIFIYISSHWKLLASTYSEFVAFPRVYSCAFIYKYIYIIHIYMLLLLIFLSFFFHFCFVCEYCFFICLSLLRILSCMRPNWQNSHWKVAKMPMKIWQINCIYIEKRVCEHNIVPTYTHVGEIYINKYVYLHQSTSHSIVTNIENTRSISNRIFVCMVGRSMTNCVHYSWAHTNTLLRSLVRLFASSLSLYLSLPHSHS